VALECGLLWYFFKLTKVNNHLMGETSPNLVTLLWRQILFAWQKLFNWKRSEERWLRVTAIEIQVKYGRRVHKACFNSLEQSDSEFGHL
jgi:hypothetical protein